MKALIPAVAVLLGVASYAAAQQFGPQSGPGCPITGCTFSGPVVITDGMTVNAMTMPDQTQAVFFASPSASGGAPGFRQLASSDVVAAMGFTPYNAANPSNYIASGGAPVQSVVGRTGAVTLAVADVTGAAPLASPGFSGVPTAATASPGTATTQLASTAFVGTAISAIAASPLPCATGSKIFCGTATTAANGTFTATIVPPCGSTPSIIQVNAQAPGTALSNQVNGSWTSATATTVSGLVTTPATLAALGLTVVAPPTGTAVNVMGVCP